MAVCILAMAARTNKLRVLQGGDLCSQTSDNFAFENSLQKSSQLSQLGDAFDCAMSLESFRL
eukprot:7096259-Karenia_brevis.AAC.1